MLRQAWKPVVGTAVLVGAPSYIYYRYYLKPASETFDLRVRTRGPDGKPVVTTRAMSLLSKDQINARLTEHATSKTTPRPGIVWKQATAHLASNNPIEDAYASAFVQRDATDPAGPGDLLFFAVMDGHGGPHTSRLLSQVLLPAVALELHQLSRTPESSASKWPSLQNIQSLLYPTAVTPLPFDSDPERVKRAIQTAFLNLDWELINAPMRILAEHADALKKGNVPDLSQHPMALASMKPAMSGSCALMALFDTAHENLYVACTGDSRAVAGVYEETEDGRGSWRVEVLSEDQTGRNPNELKRIQSEHPADEADTVIMRGRVLGGLEPSRAFGDARYKWPREVQTILNKAFLEGTNVATRSAPTLLKTPPYVTSRPEVTHRKLPFLGDPSRQKLRFVVLATDGLWDEISSEEVVALVGGYLSGLKGTVAKADLPDLVPTSSGSRTVEGKDKRHQQDKQGAWAFVDDNVSTHLIRNAFGGANDNQLRKVLSIPAPLSRNYRDDVTVTVVWWEEGRGLDAQADLSRSEQAVKSKL